MKKLLAILLAVLTVFSFSSMMVFAEDVSETETETEGPTFNTYEICEDPDFNTLTYLDKGNAAATILQPGDVVNTYKTKSRNGVTVFYYPDADAKFKGEWKAADLNNIAFSPNAVAYFKDDSAKAAGVGATIQDIDYTDFTIAYSDENVFVGWAVLEFNATANSITLVGVWEKNHKVSTTDDTEDLLYILNFFYSIPKAISSSIMKVIKVISNAFLFVKQWFYDLMFTKKA